jgi:hypothetical protein
VTGDPISEGCLVVIYNQDGEQDVLSPQEDAGTSICFNYMGAGVAAVRHEGSHRVLYFGYGLENTRSDNPSCLSPHELMDKSLGWFAIITPVESGEITSVPLPRVFHLAQNHPNPFNAATRISFQVPESMKVSLKVFNVRGQEVKTLLNEQVESGRYSLLWDGTDHLGTAVASGIYFCQMRAGALGSTVKMLLLR